jgi:GTPase
MRFVDQVRVVVRAGRGGDGAVAWRREANVPKGGPAGGDGGDGGDVILVADPHLSTLLDLRFRQRLHAEAGQPGGTRDCNGRAGVDLVVKVPVGTMIYLEGPADAPPPAAAASVPAADEDDGEGMQNVYIVHDPDALARLRQAGAELEGTAHAHASERPEGDEAEPEQWRPQPESLDEDAPPLLEQDGLVVDADALDDESLDADMLDDESLDADMLDALTDAPGDEGPVIPLELVGDPLRPAAELVRHEPGQLLGDLSRADDHVVVARGGRGGRGNIHFRSATNRTPEQAEKGEPGEAWRLRLELKLLADVGIVGFPNVGKSTFIRKVSRARPKVGAYPFTTLVPNLGVVRLSGGRSMVVADVPGLIRGASEGKGLGLQFLRHLERTRVLLHLLAPDPEPGRDPLADLEALEHELSRYGSQFDGRPRVVALNKLDLLHDDEGREQVARLREQLRARNIPLFTISAQTGAGIPRLLEALWRRLSPPERREPAV